MRACEASLECRRVRTKRRFVPALGRAALALLAALSARRGDRVLRLPRHFPTAESYAAKLAAHGFALDEIALLARPTPLPTGMRAWLEMFASPFFDARDASYREQILDDVTRLLAPSLCDDNGRWTADYVRLRLRLHL